MYVFQKRSLTVPEYGEIICRPALSVSQGVVCCYGTSVIGRSVKSHYFQDTSVLISIILVNVFTTQISKYETPFHMFVM